MIEPITVDFLRHGEARGGQYYRGITDDPLTERGWRQMYSQCGEGQWDAVICSPLRRCRSFASAWCEQQQLELLVEPAWMEIDFGDWEGQTAEQIGLHSPDALQAFYLDPVKYPPPNAETYPNFAERVRNGWEGLLADRAGQKLLVVTHAGVIRALFAHVFDMPATHSFRIEVPHGCLTRFTCFDDGNGRFVQLNFHKPG
ncbi:alpha-ribazole phosphatase family protein [Methylomonas montana]|uniref:histidine phosphatase family protein n=1 Tax=Methylomonas montana TaxID=3058963 RepID=UPI00265A8A54|nr:alpha-ribazole phosphatase family protein [Methylomonas montana]WKJ89154.1 alpha-ribazole phosphatase family protein [Methylomonas montana]